MAGNTATLYTAFRFFDIARYSNDREDVINNASLTRKNCRRDYLSNQVYYNTVHHA